VHKVPNRGFLFPAPPTIFCETLGTVRGDSLLFAAVYMFLRLSGDRSFHHQRDEVFRDKNSGVFVLLVDSNRVEVIERPSNFSLP